MEENNIENNDEQIQENENGKNWLTALILCWFLGFLGVHRLYVGKLGSGFLIAYLTIVAACILSMDLYLGLIAFVLVGAFVTNDFLIILAKKFKDCYGNEIAGEDF